MDVRHLLYSTAATLIGILLHELAHLFAALAFGLEATLNFAANFLLPAYVETGGSHGEIAIIALAGPIINLLAWLIFRTIDRPFLQIFARVNLILFIINILPVPPLFDGYKALYHGLSVFA